MKPRVKQSTRLRLVGASPAIRQTGALVNRNAFVGDAIRMGGREFIVDRIDGNVLSLIGEPFDIILTYDGLFEIKAVFTALIDDPASLLLISTCGQENER